MPSTPWAGIVVSASTAGQLPKGPPTAGPGIIEAMPAKRKRPEKPLDPYRRVRKPVPPPERVIPDRRSKLREDEAERERLDPGR